MPKLCQNCSASGNVKSENMCGSRWYMHPDARCFFVLTDMCGVVMLQQCGGVVKIIEAFDKRIVESKVLGWSPGSFPNVTILRMSMLCYLSKYVQRI